VLCLTALVVAVVIGIFDFAGSPVGPDFSPTVD
jgi:hypothetical protein